MPSSPRPSWLLLFALPGLLLPGCGRVDDPALQPFDDPRYAAPPPALRDTARNPRRNLYFGDLHIHTAYSFDAYTFGVRALPDDAYRFCKGETIQHAVGYPIRLSRPLDFAAVTDHAEYLGMARHLARAAGEEEYALRRILETGSRLRITLYWLRTVLGRMASPERAAHFGGRDVAAVSGAAWRETIAAAERHDDPGRFTTFVGYEWTSMPDEDNLHRNVLYRDAKVPARPFSVEDSEDPRDLWRALDEQRARGMRMLAIPHNGNVSNGRMYGRFQFDGTPMTRAYVETRLRNEPIQEILQVKGASETHPALSPEDEFADFEIFDQRLSAKRDASEPKGSHARDALRTGLVLEGELGLNPYRFGVIGSSDGHNASAPVEEASFHGKLPLLDGTPGLRLGESLLLPEDAIQGIRWSAMGLAAVWAEENTRGALFDALLRRETYATSGPRIRLRFFGGWRYEAGLVDARDRLARADGAGVPMGGVLPPRPADADAPRFLVLAAMDPDGAHLDRIQIVKGWLDAAGRSHERIFDVAASDGRVPDPATGRLPPVGNTVDVAAASYTNTIGSPRLEVLWRDPDFDPAQPAFYYARVLEIPTPRWSTYDAKAMGVPAPEPASLQERAITSPIWALSRSDAPE